MKTTSQLILRIAAVLVALCATASADDPVTPAGKAEAKAHADAGTNLFNIQQYAKAAEEYQQAYLVDPQPGYLWAAGQAQRLGGDCVNALRSYQAFLRTNPPDPTKVQTNISRCEEYLKDHPPPPDPTTTPTAAPVEPKIIVRTVQAPERPMISRPWTNDWIGHGFVGGGVAVAAVGVLVFLDGRKTIQANNDASSYEQFASGRSDLGSARTKQTIGVSAIAVGGTLVLGGVLHYVLHTRPIPDTSVTASVSSSGAAVGVSTAF